MSSDEELPLTALAGANGRSHVIVNANGHPNGDADDSPMSEDDMPLSQANGIQAPGKSRPRKRVAVQDSDSEGDDIPLASSPAKKTKPAAVHRVSHATANASNGKTESDSDAALATVKRKRAPNGKAKAPPAKKVKVEEGASASDDEPLTKKRSSGKVKVKPENDVEMVDAKPTRKRSSNKKAKEEGPSSESPQVKKKGKKKEEEDTEDVYRWWEEQANGDGEVKWQTLEHNGVIFPPPYEPLPSNVKMKYKGKEAVLPPESEEVAGFYAAMLDTDHAQDKTFNKNFFEDWLKVLKDHPPRNKINITEFDQCDFRPMFEYFEAEKAKKKALSTAEKKELKKQKDAMEEKYMTCLLDGRKEKVGNFRVEPPGLFRGRGDHPKKGALKFRVRPEDITLNIGEGVSIPVPNMSGSWKGVVHDQTVTWLANWVENVNGNYKYVFLAAGSSLKGQSDMSKFEKARELKSHVARIRTDYQADLKSKVMADRQRATAMYFIDRLALRAGNEKGEDEADTVGCCSLRCEHVTLEAPNFIIFDFLGKDSIRYYNRVAIEAQVFKNIRLFKDNKGESDNLFDRVNTSLLNKHLQSEQLDEGTPQNVTVQEKLNAYNHANRMVAILCNHQRSAPKTHDQSMSRMRDRLRSFKYDRMKLRHVLFNHDSKYQKNKLYADDESDIDDEWIVEHEESLKNKDIEKAEKKFAKDNEKLAEEGGQPSEDSVLKDRITVITADYKRLAKERGTGKAVLKRERPVEKIEEAIQKLDERIKTFKLQMDDREAGKEVALGTSKINYLDPRITAAWCKKHDVPIEKIFSKTLLNKCKRYPLAASVRWLTIAFQVPWAMEAEGDWKF
ncbi:DNA topoisomerase I [Boletus reticuloceps]|uniref:DNA topoisomerase 1 n=1 Tax=Boletus reticuloceps TaxID=495285 RepID=A0A8I2YMM2_9AGAM|nr:DNA topoisomerase I [Boletus reticuloceps]